MREAYAGSASLYPGDLAKIKEVTVAGVPLAGKLREQAAALERTAQLVETKWEQMPEHLQHLLMLAVYASLDKPPSFWRSVRRPILFIKAITALVQLLRAGDIYAVNAFVKAQTRYRQAVLDAIERNNAVYTDQLAEALAHLPDSAEGTISASEYMRQIRELSDSAV